MSFPLWLRILLHPTFIWILLQGVALYTFARFSPLPRSSVQRWSLHIQQAVHRAVLWIMAPWRALREVERMEKLVAELQTRLVLQNDAFPAVASPIGAVGDFSALSDYTFLPARVIYQSFLLRENYALLNKGGRDGVYPGLGVISAEGVIGIVAETTATYSIMYSLFHKSIHLSVTLPRHGVIGITTWNTSTLNRLQLEYIPLYIPIVLGEEVWTASNSLIFPAGLRVGIVKDIRSDFTRGFYTLEVDTYADWTRLGTLFILLPRR